MSRSLPVSARIELDRQDIAQLLQNWLMWRDGCIWAKLRSTYAPDATMVTSWFDGSAADFIEGCIRIQQRSLQSETRSLSHHLFDGAAIEVRGERAVAETRVTLLIRLAVHGVECDITAIGGFYDLLRKVEDRWLIRRRVTRFDKDSLSAVDPAEPLHLDRAVLARFPAEYRYTAYALAARGVNIRCDLPVPGSRASQALYESGESWLLGGSS